MTTKVDSRTVRVNLTKKHVFDVIKNVENESSRF